MGQVRVIDVSNNNGMVDWGQVLASGVAGAIVKCTEGTAFVDGQFIRNWTALGNAAVFRGAYHFARPGSSTPQQQAGRFMGIVRAVKATDILVLDLEVGDGDLSGWALGFLNEVRRLCGLTPWLYSGDAFIRAHLQNPALAQYPLWLANYRPTPPPCPPPWTAYRLWQHTPTARIPGVTGPCDESLGILDPPPVTEAQAMARISNPVGSPQHRPGAGPEQFGAMSIDGAMYCENGAPYCGAYNQHSDWWGGPAPNSVRNGLGFVWDDDGWGYVQYFDDGAWYHHRAQGH